MTFVIQTSTMDKANLLSLLRSRHTGRDNAAKKSELLTALHGPDAAQDKSYNNMLDRKLRKMIEELINDGHSICSSAQYGYWYAASLEDGLPSVRENKSRAMTQLANVNKLEKNILNEYGGQMGMGI